MKVQSSNFVHFSMFTESCVGLCELSRHICLQPALVVSVSSRQRGCDAEASLTEMGSKADRRKPEFPQYYWPAKLRNSIGVRIELPIRDSIRTDDPVRNVRIVRTVNRPL